MKSASSVAASTPATPGTKAPAAQTGSPVSLMALLAPKVLGTATEPPEPLGSVTLSSRPLAMRAQQQGSKQQPCVAVRCAWQTAKDDL